MSLQYKSIAQVNESALKQMECAHENFKTEVASLVCLNMFIPMLTRSCMHFVP